MPAPFIAFAGARRLAAGGLPEVGLAAKRALDAGEREPILVFDVATSRLVDLDLRGEPAEIAARLADPGPPAETPSPAPRGPGRPRLGVVAREVTLLPRHWNWLADQPGGASVALRKLVEQARRDNDGPDRRRRAREATYRFMSVMAGDRVGFEEAARALFSADEARFATLIAVWPGDVREHLAELAAAGFGTDEA